LTIIDSIDIALTIVSIQYFGLTVGPIHVSLTIISADYLFSVFLVIVSVIALAIIPTINWSLLFNDISILTSITYRSTLTLTLTLIIIIIIGIIIRFAIFLETKQYS